VEIARVDGDVHVTVSDRGHGFDPGRAAQESAAEFGLFSIRERLRQLGGSLEVESAPGRGTRIELCIPDGRDPTPPPAQAETATETA